MLPGEHSDRITSLINRLLTDEVIEPGCEEQRALHLSGATVTVASAVPVASSAITIVAPATASYLWAGAVSGGPPSTAGTVNARSEPWSLIQPAAGGASYVRGAAVGTALPDLRGAGLETRTEHDFRAPVAKAPVDQLFSDWAQSFPLWE